MSFTDPRGGLNLLILFRISPWPLEATFKKMSGKCDKFIKKSKSKAHFALHGARLSCSRKCSITLRTDIFSEPGLD